MEPSTLWLALLILKLTILATAAWLVDFSLRAANPRWRVGLWRVTLVAACVLLAAAFAPPLYRWEIVRVSQEAPTPVVAAVDRLQIDEAQEPAGSDEAPAAQESTAAVVPPRPVERLEAFAARPLDDPDLAQMAPLPEAPAPPAAAPIEQPSLASRLSFSWPQVALAFWGLGILYGFARMALGVVRVRRVVARSEEVSPATLVIAQRLANDLRVRLPDVRSSAEVTSPVLYGVLQPTILLPASMAVETPDAELDAALAHELAHVAGHDASWDLALRLAACLAWPHPLAWHAPAAHRQACDRVSDLVAAEALGDRGTYGRSLARIALRVAEAPPGAGLAMARRADVVERVRLIASDVRVAALGRRGWLATTLVGCAVLGLGGFAVALTTRTVAAAEPEPSLAFELTVLAAENDRPVSGAEVQLRLTPEPYDKEKILNLTETTNENGTVRFSYPDWDAASISFTVRSEGFVAYYVQIDRQPRASFPKAKTVRLERGEPIGGVLVDEEGKPYAGAKYTVRGPATETVSRSLVFSLGEGTTDDSGRWRLDAAPKELERVRLAPEMPGFPLHWLSVRAGLDEKYVIPRGWTLRGIVRTTDGEPIADAPFTVGGGTPQMKTDAEGRFAYFGLGSQPITLTVGKEKFAPWRSEILPPEEGVREVEVDVVLEPGKTLRVRVLDAKGKAIKGATVRTWNWRGESFDFWTGSTDAEGFAEWNGAPSDEVRFYIGASGFIGRDEFPLVAGEAVHEIRLVEQFAVSGTVVDDATGEPIPKFTATIRQQLGEGSPPRWFDDNPSVGLNGQFELTRNREAPALSVKIEAEGYSLWTSEAMPPTGVQPPLNVRVKKAAPDAAPSMQTLAGRVTDAQGKPVAGVQVMLGIDSERQLLFQREGAIYRTSGATTDATGRFEFEHPAIPDEAGRLSAVHDSGYAEMPLVDFRKDKTIRLQRWARLEVVVMRGSEPAAFRRVSFRSDADPDNFVLFSAGNATTTTDAHGLAVLERVPPGPGHLSVNLMQSRPGGGGRGYPERYERLALTPGETKRIQLGGTGRAIVGRIELPPDPPMPHDWATNEAGSLEIPGKTSLDVDRRLFRFLVQTDGSFRIDDVPAGTWQLDLTLFGRMDRDTAGRGKWIGKASFGPFEHRDDDEAPHDLGVIRAEWNDRVGQGDLAPAFVAATADGGTTTLADYRGKLLLMNFWNSREAESTQAMSDIAQLRETIGNDDRFATLSVAVDAVFPAAAEAAKNSGWTWTIAKGDLEGIFGETYDLYTTPESFLVGPDGRILYRGKDIKALQTAIDAALKQKPAERPEATSSFVPVDDSAFRPTGDVATIVVFDRTHAYSGEQDTRQATSGTFLFGNDGALLRRVESGSGPQIGIRSGLIAVDAPRGRAYLLEEYGQLTVYDRQGHRLSTLNVPSLMAVAVDGSNGDLWCQCKSGRDGWTLIFDAQGRQKGGHAIVGMEAKFSPVADAFWFGGSSAKLVDRTGKILAERRLDDESPYLRYVTADPEGSCWAIEQLSRGSDGVFQRVWRFTKEAAVEVTSFRYDRDTKQGTLCRWIEAVGDEVWVAHEDGEGKDRENREGRIRRYSPKGELLGELALELRDAAPFDGGLWGLTEDKLVKLDAAGNVTESYPNQNPLPKGHFQNVWIESFLPSRP